ncbi:MAG TPA: HDOD domain-containing protein [Polyangia bacterium]|jgi:EAL and modified HD-GYP domain-containing signal transduction protein|nr:HDOD domain-containing protein [Polyangia bacterium]
MQVFVARQPIFDTRQRVVAYELLFRSGIENYFPRGVDSDFASSRVINDSMMVFGFAALAGGRKLYVNVTQKVLCDALYSVLPVRQSVVELLESVKPDATTVAACRDLKRAGYELALDDYVDSPEMEPLLALADVIKIDFLATTPEQRKGLRERFKRRRLGMLAEKVETQDQLREARELGYSYFQGYFFQRPEMIAREDIPPFKLTHLDFLRELQQPDLNFDRIEAVIKRDVSLSVKLLRYLNSASFYWRSRVTSLKHAMVLLGESAFRKWASLITIVGISNDRPPELVVNCLVRAHFCEALARTTKRTDMELDAFLVGMLSAIDALVGRPCKEVLDEISVSPAISAAVLGADTTLGRMRAMVLAYETADWAAASVLANQLGVAEDLLPDVYQQSIKWAKHVMP